MGATTNERTDAMAANESPSVELVKADDAQTLAEVLSGMAEVEQVTPEEQQEIRFRMIAELLSAETEDDLWKELPTWSSKDAIGVEFEITDAHAWRSKFGATDGEAPGGFLACNATRMDTGEVGILNTGAMRLAARIGWYKIHGRLPVRIRIVERSKSANGYPILDAELV